MTKSDSEALNADFTVGEWPAHVDDREHAVVNGGMRGIAVPGNSPNKELAPAFAQFLLSQAAQQLPPENVGAAVRDDLAVDDLSERHQYFAKTQDDLNACDFPESLHPFNPKLEATYHRTLLDAIANPPEDWDAFISRTAEDMREEAARLSQG